MCIALRANSPLPPFLSVESKKFFKCINVLPPTRQKDKLNLKKATKVRLKKNKSGSKKIFSFTKLFFFEK